MGSDSRGLIAIALSVLFFIAWYSYISPKYFPKEEAKGEAIQEIKEVRNKEEKIIDSAETVEQKEIKEIISKIETDNFVAEFSNYGAVPVSWKLKKYTSSEGDSNNPVNLIPTEKLSSRPLSLHFNNFIMPETPKYDLIESSNELLKYRWAGNGIIIEKTYSVGKVDYEVNLKTEVTNNSGSAFKDQLAIGWSTEIKEEKKGGILNFLKRPSDIKEAILYLNGKVKRERSPSEVKKQELTGKLYWAGIEDRYFIAAIIPMDLSDDLSVEIEGFKNGEGRAFSTSIIMPETTVVSGSSEAYDFIIYAGPKEMQTMKMVGLNLDKSIDYGWFSFIAIPILYVLKFLYSIVHNYGVAIIILTILIKILLHPISKKSMKSMKEMQKLQPRLKQLKEKYKDDKQKLNAEMMQLFKAHKVNPMSGCLPMVLQFPVYIALYRVLWNSIELYHAPFFWFYKDLSQADPYFITPVLLGIFMFLQQKLTPTATADPAQQKMMMMMPLMFTVFLAFLPVGLVIYILVNTVTTVVQQYMNNNDIRFRDIIKGKFPKKAKA